MPGLAARITAAGEKLKGQNGLGAVASVLLGFGLFWDLTGDFWVSAWKWLHSPDGRDTATWITNYMGEHANGLHRLVIVGAWAAVAVVVRFVVLTFIRARWSTIDSRPWGAKWVVSMLTPWEHATWAIVENREKRAAARDLTLGLEQEPEAKP